MGVGYGEGGRGRGCAGRVVGVRSGSPPSSSSSPVGVVVSAVSDVVIGSGLLVIVLPKKSLKKRVKKFGSIKSLCIFT